MRSLRLPRRVERKVSGGPGTLSSAGARLILVIVSQFFSRLVGGVRQSSDATDAAQVLNRFVEHSLGLRIMLYASARDLSDVLGQRHKNVKEVLSSQDVTAEVGASYLNFVSGKVSGKSSQSETVELTPVMKAILLEETEKERGLLADLTAVPPLPGHLLLHVGRSWLFGPWSERLINSEMELAVGSAAVAQVETARAEQARKLAWGKPDHPGTLVWVARGSVPLAAIGSYENAEGNSFASYEPHPPFGFLGVLEADIQTCVLLKPLAIWHQSVQPNA